jgi:hypothetical protein
MAQTPNLRTWQPTAGDAKDVESTKMLNTEASEAPDTVTAVNENKEYVVGHPDFGQDGATGRS